MTQYLYTYVPKDNTVDKDGILSTAMAPHGWEKYTRRTHMDKREDVLAALDKWQPGFRRSYGISAFREPIPQDAHPDFRAFADAKSLYRFDAPTLIAAGILTQIQAANVGRKGVHKVKRVSYNPIDWPSKKPGAFLFSNVPHYIVETADGRIPPEYVERVDRNA